MRLTIPDVPPSLNRVMGKHWRVKNGEKDKWILLVRSQIIPVPMSRISRKRVKITLHHSRPYDKDNAYGAVKPVVDALRHWNLIWDDTREYLDLAVEQEKCPHKQRYTVIEIGEAHATSRP